MRDGTLERADAILWATGFRADICHLAPLHLRTASGGVRVENGWSTDEPRLFLIGYGPSLSTVGPTAPGATPCARSSPRSARFTPRVRPP